MSDLKLKIKPHWSECSYCLKPVGLIGRGLSWLMGTGMHECNFSNLEGAISMEDIRPDTYGAGRSLKPPKQDLPFRLGQIRRSFMLFHVVEGHVKAEILTDGTAALSAEQRVELAAVLRNLADVIDGLEKASD